MRKCVPRPPTGSAHRIDPAGGVSAPAEGEGHRFARAAGEPPVEGNFHGIKSQLGQDVPIFAILDLLEKTVFC